MKHEAKGYKHLIIEDESHNIGRIYIPKPLFTYLKQGELVILNTPMQERVDIIFDEYVTQALQIYYTCYAEEGMQEWFVDTNDALVRIKKRIGYERYIKIHTTFSDAYALHKNTGDTSHHKIWIEMLLREYYDPMYDYQIEKGDIHIAFEGNYAEVLVYLHARG